MIVTVDCFREKRQLNIGQRNGVNTVCPPTMLGGQCILKKCYKVNMHSDTTDAYNVLLYQKKIF